MSSIISFLSNIHLKSHLCFDQPLHGKSKSLELLYSTKSLLLFSGPFFSAYTVRKTFLFVQVASRSLHFYPGAGKKPLNENNQSNFFIKEEVTFGPVSVFCYFILLRLQDTKVIKLSSFGAENL